MRRTLASTTTAASNSGEVATARKRRMRPHLRLIDCVEMMTSKRRSQRRYGSDVARRGTVVSTRKPVGAHAVMALRREEEGKVASNSTLWLNGEVDELQETVVEWWASWSEPRHDSEVHGSVEQWHGGGFVSMVPQTRARGR